MQLTYSILRIMSKMNKEQQQLLTLMRNAYQVIIELEQALNLRVSQQDHRPRIDYFYDAARALTDGTLTLDYRQLRLSVEWLAYDATAIRYLEHHPLAALTPSDMHHAASTQLMVIDPALPSAGRHASRGDKTTLKQEYLRFGVAFVALFKPFADRDHRDKKEEMEEQIGQLAALEDGLEKLALGELGVEQIRQILTSIDDVKLKAKLEALLSGGRFEQSQAMSEAIRSAGYGMADQEQGLATMEKAHMEFLTAQLGIYEQGKTVVKELAGQGLNVAGQHFEQVMSQTSGQGLGRS